MSSPNTVALALVKLQMFSVVKRRKNHLDILEGHFSNNETRARPSKFQLESLERCKGEIWRFPPKANKQYRNPAKNTER